MGPIRGSRRSHPCNPPPTPPNAPCAGAKWAITGINYEAFGISTINAPGGPWTGPDGGMVNSELNLRGGRQKDSAVLLLEDPTSTTEISDITVESRHIRATLDATVTKFFLASMNCPRVARLRISNCTHPAFAGTRTAVALMNISDSPLVLAINTTFS